MKFHSVQICYMRNKTLILPPPFYFFGIPSDILTIIPPYKRRSKLLNVWVNNILHFRRNLKSPSEGHQRSTLLSALLSLFFIVWSLRLFVSIIIVDMHVLPKTSSGRETDILVGPNYFRGSNKLLDDWVFQ